MRDDGTPPLQAIILLPTTYHTITYYSLRIREGLGSTDEYSLRSTKLTSFHSVMFRSENHQSRLTRPLHVPSEVIAVNHMRGKDWGGEKAWKYLITVDLLACGWKSSYIAICDLSASR